MLGWLKKLRRTREEAHDVRVEQQEEQQVKQFDAWKDTLKEVHRVQRIAEGKPVGGHR